MAETRAVMPVVWDCPNEELNRLCGMISAQDIADLQKNWTEQWHDDGPYAPACNDGFNAFAEANHRRNFDLWHEEDRARRDDMGFEYVYHAKRAIDSYNQQRNDFIERMDQALFEAFKPDPDHVPVNSETPGMIIDRLSILALKVYHMREQTERIDASPEHLAKCRERLAVLQRQREDLTRILQHFLGELEQGTRAFRVYFQFKMYNDPAMNPELYRKS